MRHHVEHDETKVDVNSVNSTLYLLVQDFQGGVCLCVSVWSLSVQMPDGLGKEAVAESGREGPNASVAFARWQEGEEIV